MWLVGFRSRLAESNDVETEVSVGIMLSVHIVSEGRKSVMPRNAEM